MKRFVSVLLVALLLSNFALAGLGSDKSAYVGGTAPLKQGTEGVIDTSNDKSFTFPGLTVPYDKVASLAYGQHAGRRVGATVALGVTTLGIGALPMLFSKKRRHYLTVEYADADGKAQAAIFEVGKDAVRTLLKTLE